MTGFLCLLSNSQFSYSEPCAFFLSVHLCQQSLSIAALIADFQKTEKRASEKCQNLWQDDGHMSVWKCYSQNAYKWPCNML